MTLIMNLMLTLGKFMFHMFGGIKPLEGMGLKTKCIYSPKVLS